MSDFEARFLDSRIPRFTSIDPLAEKKPWVSPYHYCSNNPVNRVDPNGRDDYFNSRGHYSHSTPRGSTIRIMTANGERTPSQLNVKGYSNLSNRYAVGNVAKYYAGKVGVSGSATVGVGYTPKDGTAFTRGHAIRVNTSKEGYTHKALDDAHAMQSSLYHEKIHQDAEHGEITALEHAEVYIGQIEHSSFAKTSPDFQEGTLGMLTNFISEAYNVDGVRGTKIEGLVNSTNQALEDMGVKFQLSIDTSNMQNIRINIVEVK